MECREGMRVKVTSWLALVFGFREGMPIKAPSWVNHELGLGRVCRAMLLRLIFIACTLFEENAPLKPLRPLVLPGEEIVCEFYSLFS